MADTARSLANVNASEARQGFSSLRLQDRNVLNSWKEIAAYLDRGIRTVQRWHKDLRLPVHKLKNTRRASVFAYRAELDQWMRACAKREQTESLNDPVHQRCATVRLTAKRTTNLASSMLSLVSQKSDHVSALIETLNRVRNLEQRKTPRQPTCSGSSPQAG